MYLVKYSIEFDGNMFINMALAEIPFSKITGFYYVFKESMDFKTLKNIDAKAVLKRSRRFMSNYVVN